MQENESEDNSYNVDTQLAENEEVDNDEEDTNEESISKVYEKKRKLLEDTKIVKQTWSILEIYQKIKDNKLLLSPDYQRNKIWDSAKQTAFIESLFMGIIIPPVYVVEIPGENILEENKYEVVDGKQRLTTIFDFIKNGLVLKQKSLEYYNDWFGNKTFIDIQENYSTMTNEMLSSVLDIYVITANSPEFTKYDIFSRLNKGAEKLKVNEIRKAIYRSPTLKIIEDYVKKNYQQEQYKLVFTPNDIKRYEDFGRFYRSIAYYLRTNITIGCVEGYNSRPREMINDVLYKIQKKEIIINESKLQTILDRTIELLLRFNSNTNKQYLVDACIQFTVDNYEKIKDKFSIIENDSVIIESLKKSPSTTTNVNKRIDRVGKIVNG